MKIDLRIKNIVLVGLFNVQGFDKYFFIKNKIVTEDEILPSSLFNVIGGVQLSTNNFQIVVQPNQVVVTDLKPGENRNEINKVVESLILSVNIAGITAAGINFHYYAFDDSAPIAKLSKDLFYNENVKLFSTYFKSEDARFGLYASVNFKDSRLKLDVKPSTIQEAGSLTPIDMIAFIFNFHFDLANRKDNSDILKYLQDYDSYLTESQKIVSIYKQ